MLEGVFRPEQPLGLQVTRMFSIQGRDEFVGIQLGARLPRALAGAVEVGIFDRVGQVDGVAADEIEGSVAVDFLIGQGERLGIEPVLADQAIGCGVDGPGNGLAIVAGVIQVAVEEQFAKCGMQVGIVLAPGIAQLGGVERAAQGLAGEQVGADEVDGAVASRRAIPGKITLAGRGVLILERTEVARL